MDHLIIRDNKRVFDDFTSAESYATLFYKMNEKYYADIESAVMYQTVGDCLKYALEKEYLQLDDFYTTDEQVLDKITAHISKEQQLAIYWQRMNNQLPYKNNPDDFDNHVLCKSRVVDPLFIYGNAVKRLSDIDDTWKIKIQQ